MHQLYLLSLLLFLSAWPLRAQWLVAYEKVIPLEKEGAFLSFAWAGGLNSGQYYNLDLDLDGQQDLIIFDRTSDQFIPFISRNNEFIYAPEYSLLLPHSISNWVVFADYDGDGRQDLFTASGKRSITVYRNVSDEQLAWELIADPIATLGFSGFQVAIQLNATDIPAISDIDSDGDLDIVVYNVNGRGNLEYYQNMSREETGSSSSLMFEARDRQWGNILECDCGTFAFGGQSCEEIGARSLIKQAKLQHVGAKTLLAFDADGDGDKDLLTSDEGCGELYFLENTGSAENALFESFRTDFPESLPDEQEISFPAAFYVDVTHDGIRDLLIAPNKNEDMVGGTNMTASSWLYENTGTESNPEFRLLARDFLQNEMLDVGANASPTLADYDADGDLDLFVGHRGNLENGVYAAGIYLYENTGSATEPAFSYISSDYLGIRSLGLQQIQVYFEDMDGNGLPDMLLSGVDSPFASEAELFWLQNQAVEPGSGWSFDLESRQTVGLSFHPAERLAFDDIDEDGDQDVFIARQAGNLEYFENVGSAASPAWQLSDDTVAGISSSIFRRNLSVLLHDFDGDNQADLLSTDASGKLSFRSNIVGLLDEAIPADTAAILFKEAARPLSLGNRSWLAAGSLDASGRIFIFSGGPQGGIQMLTYLREGVSDQPTLLVYPNPVDLLQQQVSIQGSKEIRYIQLIGSNGAVIWEQDIEVPQIQVDIDTSGLAGGLYIIRVWYVSGKAGYAKLMVR